MSPAEFDLLCEQHPEVFRRGPGKKPMARQENGLWFVCHSSFFTPEFLQVVHICLQALTPTPDRQDVKT